MRRLLHSFLASIVVAATLVTATLEYVDLTESRPDDGSVRILSTGDKYSSFDRDGPFVLDPQYLQEYGSLGYLHINYKPTGDNSFEGASSPYVASIKDASVCGSEGDIWDSKDRLYRMNTWVSHPVSKLEAWRKEAETHGVKSFKRLASAVHRVSFMYFHFMAEALPRIAKFAPYLAADPEMKLLTYGTSFEQAWIQKLGIRSEQVVTFDPLFAYHADELLVSNPVEIARTPREDLVKMVNELGLPAPLPEAERTDMVYVSRRFANDRVQTNEDALLEAVQAEATAQGLRLVVHDGNPGLTADDTIAMFRRAKVVMGPNGAGLAHMLFAAPGTILVELMFINNTGMDLWHMTNALGQKYYMVPLPRSHWLDPGSDVPIEQAVATLRWALAVERKAEPACPSGSAPQADGTCASCPAGTFSTGYDSKCLACTPGWVSERRGSGYCHICLPSSYAADSTSCKSCPVDTLAAMPGSTKAEECIDLATLDEVKQSWLPTSQVVAKVSAYYQAIAKRRSMKEMDFHNLPESVKDRILSELDSCTSYSKYSTYGCNKAPQALSTSPPPSPPPAPFRAFSVRALGNGPLSGCAVAFVGGPDHDDLMTLPNVVSNTTGFASVNISAPVDLVMVKLTKCTEASLNRTGFSTLGVFVSFPPPNRMPVISPLSELASYLDMPDDMRAADFFSAYSKTASKLNVPVASYGNASDLANFDFYNATFNSADTLMVTKGTLIFVIQAMVHGISDVWSSGLAGTNKSGVVGSIGVPRAYEAFMGALFMKLENSTSSLNLSSTAVQSMLANYAVTLVDEDEPLFRRSLQTGVSLADLISAIADSVAASVAYQTAALSRLQDAVSTGVALSASDLSSILVQAQQAALAQRRVAGAASSMAAGTLSVTSFRASYTGDAFTAYMNSITVTLPDLTAQEYKKKDKHIGAIVGGVVGGFFGLVIIVVIIVVLVRRNKAHIQPRSQGDVEAKD